MRRKIPHHMAMLTAGIIGKQIVTQNSRGSRGEGETYFQYRRWGWH